jgi:hypothetical protein
MQCSLFTHCYAKVVTLGPGFGLVFEVLVLVLVLVLKAAVLVLKHEVLVLRVWVLTTILVIMIFI